MRKCLKYLLIMLFIGSLGSVLMNNSRLTIDEGEKVLPRGSQARIRVFKNEVVIQSKNEPTKRIKQPRSGEIVVEVDDTGRVLVRQPGYWPKLVLVPQLGIVASKRIEPTISVQFLRSERLGLATSLGITPSIVYLSLDKDILTNASLGFFYGYDLAMDNRVGIKFSLFF